MLATAGAPRRGGLAVRRRRRADGQAGDGDRLRRARAGRPASPPSRRARAGRGPERRPHLGLRRRQRPARRDARPRPARRSPRWRWRAAASPGATRKAARACWTCRRCDARLEPPVSSAVVTTFAPASAKARFWRSMISSAVSPFQGQVLCASPTTTTSGRAPARRRWWPPRSVGLGAQQDHLLRALGVDPLAQRRIAERIADRLLERRLVARPGRAPARPASRARRAPADRRRGPRGARTPPAGRSPAPRRAPRGCARSAARRRGSPAPARR